MARRADGALGGGLAAATQSSTFAGKPAAVPAARDRDGMLLRRCLASWGAGALRPSVWQRSGAATAAATGRTAEPGDSQKLLDYWRGLLDARHTGGGAAAATAAEQSPLSHADVCSLLRTVLLVRKVQSSLPEQLVGLFVEHYRGLGDRQDRVALLRTVVGSFGLSDQVGQLLLSRASGSTP